MQARLLFLVMALALVAPILTAKTTDAQAPKELTNSIGMKLVLNMSDCNDGKDFRTSLPCETSARKKHETVLSIDRSASQQFTCQVGQR